MISFWFKRIPSWYEHLYHLASSMIEFHPLKNSPYTRFASVKDQRQAIWNFPKANPTRLISATPYVNLKELMNSENTTMFFACFSQLRPTGSSVWKVLFLVWNPEEAIQWLGWEHTVLGDKSGAWRRRSCFSIRNFQDNQIHMERIHDEIGQYRVKSLITSSRHLIAYFFASSFHILRFVSGVRWSSESSGKKKKLYKS